MSLIIQRATRISIPAVGNTPSAHRYWRLVNVDVAAGGSHLEISEAELYEDDEVSTNSGATVTSSDAPTNGISQLVDGNTNTRCYWSAATAEAGGFWIKWDFGSGNDKLITKLRQAGYDTSNRYMAGFELQWSDDDSSWNTQATQSGLTYPGNQTWSAYYDVSS